MATRLIINVQTGEQTEVAVSDAEIIASRPPYLELSWNGSINELSAQIKTPVLSSGSRNNIAEVQTWELQIGDRQEQITTDALGAWSDTIIFVIAEPYEVYAINPENSNRITIQEGV